MISMLSILWFVVLIMASVDEGCGETSWLCEHCPDLHSNITNIENDYKHKHTNLTHKQQCIPTKIEEHNTLQADAGTAMRTHTYTRQDTPIENFVFTI